MKKIYIEIIWCCFLGFFFTFIPYYNWKQIVNVRISNKNLLPHLDYWYYLKTFTTDILLWFIIGFCISGFLIRTLKTYLKKNKEE